MNRLFKWSASTLLCLMYCFLIPLPSYASGDSYSSYAELQQYEILHQDYDIRYEQRFSYLSIMAIHGGGIEPGTSEVAKELADRFSASYYLFEGIKSTNNGVLHITSENFDEPIARGMAQQSMSVMTIHGYSGSQPIVYVGGKNQLYKELVKQSLRKHGFTVRDAPSNIAGTSEQNIVNDNLLKAGVQLELTAELRKSFFVNHDWSRNNRMNVTPLFHTFMTSLQEASSSYQTFLYFQVH
ncbi:poly-gamma-glutamate hydrolase family protein [Priestia megaterium]|uniref:poly-gamma-glutamate hydrolase family protein n=1 Tax=Priestia megaterium TaxID=1404 RepID=UPI000BA577F7|nr:poly-gamma-glutamate hydrolase family protein [Priestia megaterium]PAK54061.1 replication protein [Priestia megaterium]